MLIFISTIKLVLLLINDLYILPYFRSAVKYYTETNTANYTVLSFKFKYIKVYLLEMYWSQTIEITFFSHSYLLHSVHIKCILRVSPLRRFLRGFLCSIWKTTQVFNTHQCKSGIQPLQNHFKYCSNCIAWDIIGCRIPP